MENRNNQVPGLYNRKMKVNPICVITKKDKHLNSPYFLLLLLALSEEFITGDLIVYFVVHAHPHGMC